MSKIANMLNLVDMLRDGKIHCIQELAENLEVSKRMIRVYKDELEQAGIYINSVKGIYGGYIIDNSMNTIDVGLTSHDIEVLSRANQYIYYKEDFEFADEYNDISSKICNAYLKNMKSQDVDKYKKIRENEKQFSKIYKAIRKAIEHKNKVLITYMSINSGKTYRVIHPAELFYYQNDWYVAAFCEKRNEIRLFQLERMMEYTILEEKYFKKNRLEK